jgi:hypothetical protein
MKSYKYITEFHNWVKVNESDDENEIIERIKDLNRNLKEAIDRGPLETSDALIWFHGMMDLYDSTQLTGLVFAEMKEIFQTYIRQLYPIFNTSNKALTQKDIELGKRYKQIAASEVQNRRKNDDDLSKYGF